MTPCPITRLAAFLGFVLSGTALAAEELPVSHHDAPSTRYAIVIHGGCGSADRMLDPVIKQSYVESLTRALAAGRDRLRRGESSIDVVEHVARILEDDGHFNAGKGAVFNRNGEHELDASIMDGRNLACGAVAGVRTVKNPIALARRVMDDTDHVLLLADGAEALAKQRQVTQVPPDYFYTPRLRQIWKDYQSHGDAKIGLIDLGIRRGTIGVAALDVQGNLAAATSTGGTCFKMPGRVGDSPIVGAGTYAKNGVCAVSCTGRGEEFIRHSVARTLAARMEYKGETLQQAARHLIGQTLAPGVGGLIAVSHDGQIVLEFNTQAMLRGAADASGRFDVAIWEKPEKPVRSGSEE